MVFITGSLPDKAETLSLEQYITKANRLQEKTTSGLSEITPATKKHRRWNLK